MFQMRKTVANDTFFPEFNYDLQLLKCHFKTDNLKCKSDYWRVGRSGTKLKREFLFNRTEQYTVKCFKNN